MKNLWVSSAVSIVLGGSAMLANAQVVNLTGWTFGSGNTVHVTSPTFNGSAGGFKGTLSGFGPLFDDATFETYCVELTQQFNLPSGGMTGYSIVPGASYAQWLHPATTHRIGQLITYVNGHADSVDTAAESTSLQLAIWNSIYDTDNTLGAGGTFSDTSGFAGYANTLLANSAATVSNLNVYVLTNARKQDFLVTTPVPEPETYALMLAGLMATGFVARRRRAQA
jgi:hypothetical protein